MRVLELVDEELWHSASPHGEETVRSEVFSVQVFFHLSSRDVAAQLYERMPRLNSNGADVIPDGSDERFADLPTPQALERLVVRLRRVLEEEGEVPVGRGRVPVYHGVELRRGLTFKAMRRIFFKNYMIFISGSTMAEFDERNPRRKFRRMIQNNLHWVWIIPFSLVENLPMFFSGLFDVVVDTVTLGRHYLLAVRDSVINMNDFHNMYREDSEDDDEEDDLSSVSGESQMSRVSTRSSSKKKKDS